MLNMSSVSEVREFDDRTTKARIRDAAIDCFAEYGVAGTTARKVASAAGVSPGLVIHHFGSMEGLRSACDEHVAAIIRQQKQEAMSAGPGFDVLAALRESVIGSLAGYLARVLVEESPPVAKLVDDLVDDAEDYLQQGVESGMLRPTANPRGRAAVLTVWSLGVLVLHSHLERILGVDLTDPTVGSDPAIASYVGPVYEILSDGVFTESFGAHFRATFAGAVGGDEQKGSSTSPHEPKDPSKAARKGTS
jgi:AcrR family transcriptional regulator